MKIALDFDDTYTADPPLWDSFIADAKSRGHTVIVVTGRRRTEENIAEVQVPGCTVIFTELQAKEWYCSRYHKCTFDIWIDNEPRFITENR